MEVVSFKCPNCGGELVFDPNTQNYSCPYCNSEFSQEQIDTMQKGKQPSQESEAADSAKGQEQEEAAVYVCPNCGAEIVTDPTTAATECYYCQSPVVLSERVSGEYLPQEIIPFAIDRKKAAEIFLQNMKKKKFVPRGFFSGKQIEKMSGVYFPYWMVDWRGDAAMEAEATKVRTWRTGDTEYTETQFYRVYREGNVEFDDMPKIALQKANRKLVEGVQPYDRKAAKQFSMGYLSGFQAERRDLEKEAFGAEIARDTEQYAKRVLENDMRGYTTVRPVRQQVGNRQERWRYALVPVWVITYKGKNGKIYYYTINGQNGKVCGELPVDYKKLSLVSALITGVVFLLGLAGGFLL